MRIAALCFYVSLLFQSACASGELRHDCTISVSKSKSQELNIQVSRSEKERSRGLMYRKQMADNEGMLFVFEGMEDRSFWMKNTFLPLDMIFIDQHGTVKKILRNIPPLTETPRKSEFPVMYVLELKAGKAESYAITEGTVLDLSKCQ